MTSPLKINARMQDSARLRRILAGTLLVLGLISPACAEVILPALTTSQLDPALKGQVLIEELNCVACHRGDASLVARSKKAPRLADLGARVNPKYLAAFLRDPHGTKPGTTMPDALTPLASADRQPVALALTHFLLSLKTNDFSLQPPDAVAALQGQRLFHSRGCAACHSPRDARGQELLPKTSVPLGALEGKYSFKSLTAFLRQPQLHRPSGRMPDLRLAGAEVERIAHYLLQDTRVPGPLAYTLYRGQVWEGLSSEHVRAERAGIVADFSLSSLGKVEHHTAIQYEGWMNLTNGGRYTFFLKMNGGSLSIDGKDLVRQDPSDRRGPKELEGGAELASGWRRVQVTNFHTGYDPEFSLEMAGPDGVRRRIPSLMLSISPEPIPVLEPFVVKPELAARGREHFGKLGCANCHDDLAVPAAPATALAKLDSARGCLSGTPGPWPRFDLSTEQRDWIARALPWAEQLQLDARQQVDKTLVTFNCLACHERAGLGGIAPERKALFTGTQPSLGDQGGLPPPLSLVGAKLKPEAIAGVLLHGQRPRGYVETSMPQFGEANVGELVKLFGQVDRLEPVEFPAVANLQKSRNAGHEMIGSAGLGCILCHEFNGQRSGEVGALDLVTVAERLQKNWFHLYLRQPARFHPNVIMPSYWPDGESVRPNILGGNTAQQIEALWIYLADGGRARKPLGLSRQANELRVGDLTEICRGRSPVGYRGIGVGYPERIHLIFDAEEMALRQLWKGEFANVDLGSFHPRGTDAIPFPPGIPFHRLKSLEDSWPYKGRNNYPFPQDHGYQFRGYHLDAQRRPTFLYHYGDIAVEDYFEDVRDPNGRAYFRRTLSLESAAEPLPFYFRAAAGKSVRVHTDRHFEIERLHVRITSDHPGIVRDGNPAEVLLPLKLSAGHTTLTLEYQW